MKKLCLGKFVEENNLKGGLLFGKTGIVRENIWRTRGYPVLFFNYGICIYSAGTIRQDIKKNTARYKNIDILPNKRYNLRKEDYINCEKVRRYANEDV